MRVEVEKTRKAHELGKKCGLFRTPAVLDYDAKAGTAVFERIRNLMPIRQRIRFGRRENPQVSMLARSLAVIHRTLKLPNDMKIPLPGPLASSTNQAFLHGDMSVYNVCVERETSSLVILDWQMTPLYGGDATHGTRYFDLMWFIANLLWRPTPRYLLGDPVMPVASTFLQSYFDEAGVESNPAEIAAYAERFFDIECRRQREEEPFNWRTRFLLFRSEALTRTFIQALKSQPPNSTMPPGTAG